MPEELHQVRVRALRYEAENVISVDLEPFPSPVSLPIWEPGAHIDLLLPNGLERQYSLCGDPGASVWRIAVLHETGRGGSTYVHENLRPGHQLTVRGPRNHFAIEPATSYLFIAGGIGITPILPMIEHAESTGTPWKLLYGGRSRTSMAFLDILSGHEDKVEVVPQDERGPLDIATALGAVDTGGAVYCCGPSGLLEAASKCAAELDIPCHVERFTPIMDSHEARAGEGFEVYLKRHGKSVTVEDGESILDAVERTGISVPFSCREGTCGSCETTVLEGDVDHRDGILTDDEREEGGIMMICVSRARGQRLVLDL